MPTRLPGRGGGLNSGSMLPTFSMPKPSSTVWPDGASNRIASPHPGPSSPRAVPLDRDAPALDPLGVVVEVLELGHLEAHVVQAVGRRLAQHDRVVLVLVPALEEDPVLLVRGLDQAEHLGVVGGAELEVGDPDLDVLQAEDAVGHRVSLGLLVAQVWKRRNRCATTFS